MTDILFYWSVLMMGFIGCWHLTAWTVDLGLCLFLLHLGMFKLLWLIYAARTRLDACSPDFVNWGSRHCRRIYATRTRVDACSPDWWIVCHDTVVVHQLISNGWFKHWTVTVYDSSVEVLFGLPWRRTSWCVPNRLKSCWLYSVYRRWQLCIVQLP